MWKFSILFSCLLIVGCTTEDLYNDGSAPPGAPPGYYTFRQAQSFESRNKIDRAMPLYCEAAKAGYPGAKDKCVKYALLLEANGRRMTLCNASRFDKDVSELCGTKYWTTPPYITRDRAKELYLKKEEEAQQKAELAKQEQERQAQIQAVHQNIKAKKYDLKEEDF